MATTDKTLVSTAALGTLMQWCEDAIDFRDDSDERAAKAFAALMADLSDQSVKSPEWTA